MTHLLPPIQAKEEMLLVGWAKAVLLCLTSGLVSHPLLPRPDSN